MKRNMAKAKTMLLSAVAFSTLAVGQQTQPQPAQAVPPQAPAQTGSPEDAEIEKLRKEHQRLLKQQEIEKLRKENDALSGGQGQSAQPAQSPQPLPCDETCIQQRRAVELQRKDDAARLKQQNDWKEAIERGQCVLVKPKPCGWLCRQIQLREGEIDREICKHTKGQVCDTPEILNVTPQPKDSGTCPPGYEPAKGRRAVPPAPAAPVTPILDATSVNNTPKGGVQ